MGRSKEFVSGILNRMDLDEEPEHSYSSSSHSSPEDGVISDSSTSASEQSKEFVSGILSDLGVVSTAGDSSAAEDNPAVVAAHSQEFVSEILDGMSLSSRDEETLPPQPPDDGYL